MQSQYLKEERQQRILVALQESKKVTVAELSKMFGISPVTIRRDLAELASTGRIIRAHRGALEAAPAPPEAPVVHRMVEEQESKARIAQAAAQMVQEGEAIFIGSGSTMTAFARTLAGKSRVTVITNAINIAMEISTLDPESSVIVLGGMVRSSEMSLLGHITALTLREVRFSKIFMGVQALDLENGWTTDHLPEVQTTRQILEMAPELIILADHTKLGRTAAALIAPIGRVSSLVTDSQAEGKFLSRLEGMGKKVTVT